MSVISSYRPPSPRDSANEEEASGVARRPPSFRAADAAEVQEMPRAEAAGAEPARPAAARPRWARGSTPGGVPTRGGIARHAWSIAGDDHAEVDAVRVATRAMRVCPRKRWARRDAVDILAWRARQWRHTRADPANCTRNQLPSEES